MRNFYLIAFLIAQLLSAAEDEIEQENAESYIDQSEAYLKELYHPRHFVPEELQPYILVSDEESEESKITDWPTQKNVRLVCKICNHAPKKFRRHLYENHYICGCAKRYESFLEAKNCRLSHKRIRKNKSLLSFASDLTTVNEESSGCYQCDFCDKTVESQFGLSLHNLYMHFICSKCNTQYLTRQKAFDCKNSH